MAFSEFDFFNNAQEQGDSRCEHVRTFENILAL